MIQYKSYHIPENVNPSSRGKSECSRENIIIYSFTKHKRPHGVVAEKFGRFLEIERHVILVVNLKLPKPDAASATCSVMAVAQLPIGVSNFLAALARSPTASASTSTIIYQRPREIPEAVHLPSVRIRLLYRVGHRRSRVEGIYLPLVLPVHLVECL